MAYSWFRLYAEFQDDPKIQMLPLPMRYYFVMLLCSRCKGQPLTDAIIAYQWRVPPSEVQEIKSLFIKQGFIDEEWNVTAWDKRQYVSDSSSERVRKFRAAKKDETFPKRSEKQANGVSWNRPDTDTESDTEAESPMKRYF